MRVIHLQLMGGPGGIVSLCRNINKASHNEEYFYFIFDGGEITDKIQAEGGIVEVCHDNHFFMLGGMKRFIQYCRNNKIELLIVHANSPIVWIYALAAKSAIGRLRMKTYIHADPDYFLGKGFKRRINTFLLFLCSRKSNQVITISKYIKCKFMNVVKCDSGKVKVLYNGIDTDRFRCSHDDSDLKRVFNLIYVGRMTEFKNVKILPELISEFSEDIHFTLVGDGNQKEETIELSKRYKVTDKIEFVGNRTNIEEYLKNADLFVHPAKGEEGFGITLVEAMAAGVPCVAYKKGAIPEIIDDGQNGWIVDEYTVDAMKKKIKGIITIYQNGEYGYFRTEAQKKASNFKIENLVKSLEDE